MKRYVLTKHMREDRLERAAFIGTTIGFGNIVFTQPSGNAWMNLTDTGVIIITNNEDAIITMYIAQMEQATYVCGGEVPKELKRIIRDNCKKHLHILQNGGN